MTAVDSLTAASANQDVLGVVGHPDHFMRHYLADRKNQVESAFHNESIHLCWPRKVELAFGLRVDELRRNLAQRDNIGAPAVYAEKIARHVTEHGFDLRGLHRCMRSDSRQDGLELISVVLPGKAGEGASPRMEPRHIRRHRQNTLARPKLFQ